MDTMEHDDMLYAMLKECKTLPIFLNHIFGFLNRRTDFYHITNDKNSRIGLPPGLAEHTVKDIFYKWKSQPEKSQNKRLEISTGSSSSIETCAKPLDCNHFTKSDSYNGAVYENYSWSQSLVEVDISIKVPENIKVKQLVVNILSDQLVVQIKNGEILVEGELCHKCKHKEAIWSLQKNKIDIHLDKCQEIWWDCLVKSEPKLDITNLDCSRPYEELSEEAQVKIQEMQWNQERKRLGLPTSEELAMQNILHKSWNAEGSPFSGPFDPGAVKYN